MIIFVFLLAGLMIKTAEMPLTGGHFHIDYLSKEKTNMIKGIFVLLIMLSHYSAYVSLEGSWDELYGAMKNYLGQMVVAMFLFYSGYGIMESISKKGFQYVRRIPVKRFLVTLINFDIAVGIYFILGVLCGNSFGLKKVLLALIGWESLGNSNWYMFTIFVAYLVTFLSFLPLKWFNHTLGRGLSLGGMTIIIMGVVYWEMKIGQPSYFYNTMILFPLGGWYSYLKPFIEKMLMKNDFVWCFFFLLLFVLYGIAFENRGKYGIEGYTFWACCFTLLIVVCSMKLSFSSKILEWFGQHVFSVYILQRIPMIILQHMGIIGNHKYICFCVCFVTTVFIAMIFDYYTGRLSKKILSAVDQHS